MITPAQPRPGRARERAAEGSEDGVRSRRHNITKKSRELNLQTLKEQKLPAGHDTGIQIHQW
jgi:hypothetical protein